MLDKDATRHNPGNTQMIDAMYAYLSIDERNGFEGVCGAPVGAMGCMPLVGADMDRMMSLKPLATEMAKEMKTKIKLVKFSVKEVLEEFGP